MKYSCLIVDDEEMIAQTTSEYFNMFDVSAAYVTGYEECVEFLKHHEISLLLLDVNLGGKSGFELCKRLRQNSDVPILFISARTGDDDILTALNIGGDDYITKPYSLNILLAKVKAILRRQEGMACVRMEEAGSSVALDHNYRRVLVEGEPIHLKEMEYKLLKYLMEHKGKVVTKEELFDNVWGDSFVGDGTLSVHIRHLRQKIEKNPESPELIKTLWGVGYVFEGE